MNPDRFLKLLINYELRPGYNYDLDAYKRFLSELGNPQSDIGSIIHIAGTKGKGSIAAMIDSCLRAAGYNVGLYTSPHLNSINERIRFNGHKIPRKRLASYLKLIKPLVKYRHAARTFFEVLTAVAFKYFQDKKCDVSVLEVGLGGRLDATNVTSPMISIISRIGYDHTNLLGTRLSQIAREKAGIIKPEIPVITVNQNQDVQRVICRIAGRLNSPVMFADRMMTARIKKISLTGTDLKINGIWGPIDIKLPIIGRHQIENLKIALLALHECREKGYYIIKESIVQGLRKLHLPGRFQVLQPDPMIIFDCAHNEDSFRAFHGNIQDLGIKNFILIFGASKFKDIDYCIKKIFPIAERIILVAFENPRSYKIPDLISKAARFKHKIVTAKSVKHAIHLAKRFSDKNSILITGSFFLWTFGDPL